MFSRSRKDQEPQDSLETLPSGVSEAGLFDDFDDEQMQGIDSLTGQNQTQPEVVQVVEKISSILSPYFIVLVGLFLYKENVFIGTILISIGILSLLKVSWQDISYFLEGLKNFLGLGKSPDDTIS